MIHVLLNHPCMTFLRPHLTVFWPNRFPAVLKEGNPRTRSGTEFCLFSFSLFCLAKQFEDTKNERKKGGKYGKRSTKSPNQSWSVSKKEGRGRGGRFLPSCFTNRSSSFSLFPFFCRNRKVLEQKEKFLPTAAVYSPRGLFFAIIAHKK